MDNFIKSLIPENADVIWHKKDFARSNADVNFFYAFCKLGEFIYSLHLNRIQIPYITSPTHVPMKNDFAILLGHKQVTRAIVLSKYRVNDSGLELIESHVVDSVVQGVDPRVVSNGKKAWAIIYKNQSGIGDWGATLLDLVTLKATDITLKSSKIKYGKNWQPFIFKDQLHAVHELNPFRIIRIDETTGVAETVYESESYLPIFSSYDSYPLARGGSNAIILEGHLVGIGHATSEIFRHHPFIWSHQKSFGTAITFMDFFYHFTKHGYSLIDPTSLFEDEEFLYVGLDCHERDRGHEQKVLHILLRFKKNRTDSHKRILPLQELLDSEPVTENNGIPDLTYHRFFCTELRSAVLHEQRRGVRTSIGVPGHIVHGPYVKINCAATFSAELAYLTKNDKESHCGVFEVVAHKSNPDGSMDVDCPEYLAQSQLESTSGALMKKKLTFDTEQQLGKFLEFRVFVNKEAIVSVFDIITAKLV